MNFILQLRLKNIDGVLERVLGVVRYRNYQITKMMANPTPDGSRMDVTLTVNSDTRGGHIARHLQKLWDVESLQIYGELPQASYG